MDERIVISSSENSVDMLTGKPSGGRTASGVKRLGQLKNVFADKEAFEKLDPETVVYRVECHYPVDEGTPGGLFFGASYIMPGKVGNEYFMTKGHYHSRPECAEYYWGISGEGVLLLKDQNGSCRAEKVEKGSLHYVPGNTAHRLVNTGTEVLAVGACWPSDAGHDYGSAEQSGFGALVVEEDGAPAVIKKEISGR